MNKRIILIVTIVIFIGLGGVVTYAYLHRPSTSKKEPPTTETSQQPSEMSTESQNPSKTYPVKIYFSKHPDSDNDPAKVFPVVRQSPDLSVGAFAVAELLKGPTSAETTQGYFTTARLRTDESNCDGRDFTLVISGGTATLKFCRRFDHLGVVADGQAKSTLDATLKQFNSVQRVVILNRDGNCEFDLSGLNLCTK